MTERYDDPINGRIESALAKADLILEDLSAMAATYYAGQVQSEIRLLNAALNSGMGADDFRKEGNLVRWLPAILDYAQVADDRNERLRRLASALARSSNVGPVRSYTWTYLAFLALLILALFLFLCSTIIPVFAQMFKEFQLRLPPVTSFVIWVGSWVGPQTHTIVLAIAASAVMIHLGNRLIRRVSFDKIIVTYWQRLSFGNSENLIAMSRFAHALACLLQIGMPRPEAITIAGRASRSAICLRNAIRISTEIKTRAANACPTARCFPPLVIESLRDDGVTNGNPRVAIELLRELSQIYSGRVKQRRELLSEFLLPIALVIMGLTVGIIVLSLFMPLVSLVSALA